MSKFLVAPLLAALSVFAIGCAESKDGNSQAKTSGVQYKSGDVVGTMQVEVNQHDLVATYVWNDQIKMYEIKAKRGRVVTKSTGLTGLLAGAEKTVDAKLDDVPLATTKGFDRARLVEKNGSIFLHRLTSVDEIVNGVTIKFDLDAELETEITNGLTFQDFLLGKTVELKLTAQGREAAANATSEGLKSTFRTARAQGMIMTSAGIETNGLDDLRISANQKEIVISSPREYMKAMVVLTKE